MTVAAERNFDWAAERLHIAQPPLSRAIQQLEAELGGTLLDRTARPLVLTPVGQLFYDQACQVLRRVDDMRTILSATVRTEKRRFAIGFVASTLYEHLPALIQELRREVPSVELTFAESITLDQVSALKDGRIDVGFGRLRFDDLAIRRTVLRREPLMAAVPLHSHWGRDGQKVSLTDLAGERLLVYPSSPRPSYADQVLSLFHDHGLDPGAVYEARELQVAIGLVAAEEGVAIVPESVRRACSDDVHYVDLVEPVSSPIIMSNRIGDISPEIRTLKQIIARKYQEWGYLVPDALLSPAEPLRVLAPRSS